MPGTASLILGLLFQQLQDPNARVENLPIGNLPQAFFDTDPNLQFAAKHRLIVGDLFISVGERSVGVACTPYPGWQEFKSRVLRVWEVLAKNPQFVGPASRFSLKYVNLLEEVTEQTVAKLTKVSVSVSDNEQPGWPLQLRTEFQNRGYVDVVQVASEATALLPSGEKKGFLIDIDIICLKPPADLLGNAGEALNEAHNHAKNRFFGLLTDETITGRGARYD
jgi:uncharacterized protein (TIGR04255 family)